jgi:hypothetical protein
MSAAHTSSNCLPRVSVSLSPTVCRRVAVPSSLGGQAPSTRLCSFGGQGFRKSSPVLGGVDSVVISLYHIRNKNFASPCHRPHSYMIMISTIPGQHIVRILNIRETYIPVRVHWVDKLFLFSGLMRRTWYLTPPPSRNRTMTLDPPSSQCSSLLNLGHFHARRDAVSSFFLTLLRSDTPRIGSFSFAGTIGTCWKSFTP